MTRTAPAIFVATLNHRAAPVDVRERLALGADDVRLALRDLPDLSEAVILSTCNRVEVYGVGNPALAGAAFDGIAMRRGLDPAAVRSLVVALAGEPAIRHAFRVAASLDSMIVGESQILGQMKDAFALARECGTVGPLLHRVMEQALTVGKRVRTETTLGQHAVSVPFAAVELAKKIFGALRGTRALLIGAGEMGELAARHLRDQGVGELIVTNRTLAKAEAVAGTLGATAVPWDAWPTALAAADIVITSTGAPGIVVTREAVRDVLARRGPRPLFFVDIAVPRDVEPAVGELPDVFCYDVDDLGRVVDANLKARAHEATKAEALVDREVPRFAARLAGLGAVPTIVALRDKLDRIRAAEVERALARLADASPETRQAIDAMSSAIVNKVLHAPTVKLRETSEGGRGDQWAAAVSALFALDGAPAAPAPAPAPRPSRAPVLARAVR